MVPGASLAGARSELCLVACAFDTLSLLPSWVVCDALQCLVYICHLQLVPVLLAPCLGS